MIFFFREFFFSFIFLFFACVSVSARKQTAASKQKKNVGDVFELKQIVDRHQRPPLFRSPRLAVTLAPPPLGACAAEKQRPFSALPTRTTPHGPHLARRPLVGQGRTADARRGRAGSHRRGRCLHVGRDRCVHRAVGGQIVECRGGGHEGACGICACCLSRPAASLAGRSCAQVREREKKRRERENGMKTARFFMFD